MIKHFTVPTIPFDFKYNFTSEIKLNHKLIFDDIFIKKENKVKENIVLEVIDSNEIKRLENKLTEKNNLRNQKLRDKIFYVKFQMNDISFSDDFYKDTVQMKKDWLIKRIRNNQAKLNKLIDNNIYYQNLIEEEIRRKGYNPKMKKVDEERRKYFDEEMLKVTDRLEELSKKYNFLNEEEIKEIDIFKKKFLEEENFYYSNLKIKKENKFSKNLRKCEEEIFKKIFFL